MNADELRAWLQSRKAVISSLPHPRLAVIQVQSMVEPNNRVEVTHYDQQQAIEIAVMVFDLPMEVRRQMNGRTVGSC